MFLENYILNPYVRAIVIGAVLLLVLALVASFFARVVRLINKRTKTDFNKSQAKRFVPPILIMFFLLIARLSIDQLVNVVPKLESVAGKLVYSALVIVLGYLLFLILDVFVLSWWRKLAQKTNTKIDDNLISIIHGVLQISLIVLGIVFILDLWGFNVTSTLAGLGIAGIAVALALQPVLSNIFSGISIIFDKTINEGDIIYMDDKIEAQIIKIGLRSTKVRTSDDETIIIPNNKLADSKIVNESLPEPKIRIKIPFNVAYGSDIARVKKIVLGEINSIKGCLKSPPPSVKFLKMNESSLDFEARFYITLTSTHDPDNFLDLANTLIYEALIRNGVSIPFQQMDVHLKK
ncbi:MAG: mechanosensitive ion channel family protein [Candidatus Pacearchaeota archaeon]|jgi:MscS family membrane protein